MGPRGKQATYRSVVRDADVRCVADMYPVQSRSVKSPRTGGCHVSETRGSLLLCSLLGSHRSLLAGLSLRPLCPASSPKQKRGLQHP